MSVARSYAHLSYNSAHWEGESHDTDSRLAILQGQKKKSFPPSEVKGHLKSSSHNKHVAKVVNSVHKVKNLA